MKYNKIVIIIIVILTVFGISYYIYKKSTSQNSNKEFLNNANNSYNTSKIELLQNTSTNDTYINNTVNNSTENKYSDNNNNTSTKKADSPSEFKQNNEKKETEIASFSTKIYTKDSERQNNVSITCSKLNDTVVESGKTFSFCDTVGKATSGKGYQKADVFRNGEKIKALGGGNCQVSSTLYNAVMKISELKVTERHPHSNDVPYVKKGKDAAVSYGTYDFKFVNNTRK